MIQVYIYIYKYVYIYICNISIYIYIYIHSIFTHMNVHIQIYVTTNLILCLFILDKVGLQLLVIPNWAPKNPRYNHAVAVTTWRLYSDLMEIDSDL